jgi:hypothetical protein
MKASLWDIMDMFNTQFSFSNRVSSSTGKIATFFYVVFFMYLSIVALLSVFSRRYKNVFTQQTYDLNFSTDAEYYKKLHVIIGIAVYRNDNILVTNADSLLKQYFNFQMSYISSNCIDYRTSNFYDKKISENNNLVTYFTTYDINTLNDFLKISIDKSVLKTDADIDEFFKKYRIKFHLDYYFLKDKEILIQKTRELFKTLSNENPLFLEYEIIDYIYRTKNQDYLIINSKNYQAALNNIKYSFNPFILKLDPEIILSSSYEFKGFNLESKVKDEFSSSLASFLFKLSPRAETFSFSYKKISASFAEIAGIMNVVKFVLYFGIIIMTFIKRNQFFMNELYHNEILVKKFRTNRNFQTQYGSYSDNAALLPKEKKEEEFRGKNNLIKDSSENTLSKQISIITRRFSLSKNSKTFNIHKFNFNSQEIQKEQCNIVEPKIKGYIPTSSPRKSIKKLDKIFTRIFKVDENMDLEEVTPYKQPKKLVRGDGDLSKCEHVTLTLLNKLSNRNRKANYSCFRFFLSTLICGCKNKKIIDLKRKVFHKFYQKNMEKLDIIWVQKKLNMVDILSYVLLEPRHRVLLEYTKKEQMSLNFETGESKFSNDYALTKSIKEHASILQNYKNENLDERDRKIIRILDPRLANLFICNK